MRAKIIIQVTAGVFLNEPMPQHTRQFTVTDEDLQSTNIDYEKMQYDKAIEYMRQLSNPRHFNFVRCEWIYL